MVLINLSNSCDFPGSNKYTKFYFTFNHKKYPTLNFLSIEFKI